MNIILHFLDQNNIRTRERLGTVEHFHLDILVKIILSFPLLTFYMYVKQVLEQKL